MGKTLGKSSQNGSPTSLSLLRGKKKKTKKTKKKRRESLSALYAHNASFSVRSLLWRDNKEAIYARIK